MLSEFFVNFTLQGTQQWPEPQFLNRMLKQKMKKRLKAIPHNSKCRYGERGAADAKAKAQIILDAAKVSAASGGNSEPKQGQRSQSARGFCPRSTMRVPQPDIIEHFGNADAVPQPLERCLSRKAGIVRCCLKKPWKPQRIPAALCLTSCLCLRNIRHFLCFQIYLRYFLLYIFYAKT